MFSGANPSNNITHGHNAEATSKHQTTITLLQRLIITELSFDVILNRESTSGIILLTQGHLQSFFILQKIILTFKLIFDLEK